LWAGAQACFPLADNAVAVVSTSVCNHFQIRGGGLTSVFFGEESEVNFVIRRNGQTSFIAQSPKDLYIFCHYF
jgi:hypothetical protein